MSIVFVIAILIPFFICVPVLIGIYVYRDAKQRDMIAPVWALIAILTPCLFGFLIYLLVRSGHSPLKCPKCGYSVTDRFAICPQCGTRLKGACPNCAATVEPDWKHCPQCAQPLPASILQCTPPVQRKDRWIGKILAIVIILPLVLLIVLYLTFSFNNGTGAINTTYLTADSYVEAKADHWTEKQQQEIQLWLDSCLSAPDQAYALRYETTYKGQHIIQFLIYYPAAQPQTAIHTDLEEILLGTKMLVNFAHTDKVTEYNLCPISVYTDQMPQLEVQADGIPIDVEITDVNYSLTLFEMFSTSE